MPAGDYEALEDAIRPTTRVLLSESPTNPYIRILDLERFADIGRRAPREDDHRRHLRHALQQRPLEWGVDLVMHSATKYLGGHNDLLAGAVLGSRGAGRARPRGCRASPAPSSIPFAAYLLIRGLKTFALRMERQNANAQALAEFLAAHPRIARGPLRRAAHAIREHDVAQRQMRGFGGVVSFEVRGRPRRGLARGRRLHASRTSPSSLGGVESLIEQPAIMSFYELTTEERLEIGIKDNLIRYSVGIEDADDLIADLAQALDA